jgi:nitrilase
MTTTKVAVVQTGSIPNDVEATKRKAVQLIHQAAETGAKLAVFPEAFLGGYPKGNPFGSPVGRRTDKGRDDFRDYSEQAFSLEEDLREIKEACAETGLFVITGIIEKSGGTLYCSTVMIDETGNQVGLHRKLMPTAAERLIWGFGDGSTIGAVETPAGRAGSVICWENYMPLLRQAMYSQGIDLYCASTVDDRDQWQSTMQHIALEGRCFVLSSCQFITKDAYANADELDLDPANGDVAIRGGSVIISPLGEILAGPVYGEETILTAEVDLSERTRGHLDFDTTGHYSGSSIFHLEVDTRPKEVVSFLK